MNQVRGIYKCVVKILYFTDKDSPRVMIFPQWMSSLHVYVSGVQISNFFHLYFKLIFECLLVSYLGQK